MKKNKKIDKDYKKNEKMIVLVEWGNDHYTAHCCENNKQSLFDTLDGFTNPCGIKSFACRSFEDLDFGGAYINIDDKFFPPSDYFEGFSLQGVMDGLI